MKETESYASCSCLELDVVLQASVENVRTIGKRKTFRGKMMNPVPDRKQQRREYLMKKGTGYVNVTVAGALFIPALIASVGGGIAAVLLFFTGLQQGMPLVNDILAGCGLCVVGSVMSGIVAVVSRRTMERAQREMNALLYVPPVTADTLPAEEVLVRAAGEPATPEEILLRAASASDGTKADELLRATQDGVAIVRR